MRRRHAALLVASAALAVSAAALATRSSGAGAALAEVVPNDNREAGGVERRGVLRLDLEARLASWRPDLDVDSAVTVQVFAERGGAARIPGPLLRAAEGTAVQVSVHNALPDSVLVVHGLRAGTVGDDTLHVAPGTRREVRYRAGAPGTYLYWGTTTGSPIDNRNLRDSQLTGAIVIDARGVAPDTAERIFVMTVLDIYPSDTLRNAAQEDIWELAINGRSWPHNERLTYAVGDTVRWRWLNGSYLPHPMHLHGFHFRVLARGDGTADTTYAGDAALLAVTEFMAAGGTFRMDWVPTRAGNWLMHCHMIPHITPFPERPDSVRGHDAHDVARHPLEAMAGLVLGISTFARGGAADGAPVPTHHLRLLAQEASRDGARPWRQGYVLQRGAEPRADSVEVPGAPLILTRGRTTAITVVNRLAAPTTVHWHGMELESLYDGVAGWSGAGSNMAPLVAPGDSFTVAFTPPRAGTFIYHSHMDEGGEITRGMYGPLLVLEPGELFDPATDLVFMIGGTVEGGSAKLGLNGHNQPPPLTLRAGMRYRLRFVNMLPAEPARVQLLVDSLPLTWRPLAKDGADLPAQARAETAARLWRFGVGETYDFEWTPAGPLDATLEVRTLEGVLRQALHVRANTVGRNGRLR